MKKLWVSIVAFITMVCLVGCFGTSDESGKGSSSGTNQPPETLEIDDNGDASEQELPSDSEETVSKEGKDKTNDSVIHTNEETSEVDDWESTFEQNSPSDSEQTVPSDGNDKPNEPETPSKEENPEENDDEENNEEEDNSNYEIVSPIINGGNFNGKG